MKLLNDNGAKITVIKLLIILFSMHTSLLLMSNSIRQLVQDIRTWHLIVIIWQYSTIEVQAVFIQFKLRWKQLKKRRNLITTRSSRNVWFMLTWISSAKNLIKLLITCSCFSRFVNNIQYLKSIFEIWNIEWNSLACEMITIFEYNCQKNELKNKWKIGYSVCLEYNC